MDNNCHLLDILDISATTHYDSFINDNYIFTILIYAPLQHKQLANFQTIHRFHSVMLCLLHLYVNFSEKYGLSNS